MKCKEAQRHIMEEKASSQLEEHLSLCASCRNYALTLKQAHEVLREESLEPPLHVWLSLEPEASKAAQNNKQFARKRETGLFRKLARKLLVPAMAAAALMLAIGLWFWHAKPSDYQKPVTIAKLYETRERMQTILQEEPSSKALKEKRLARKLSGTTVDSEIASLSLEMWDTSREWDSVW